ncbi:hypothetical protein M413DRAFT_31238 [Hebeloma cylindrosporum]|uniref:Fungal-type protein kinase domain-containing protein n=1 Tax=Hebeloma cylindrosporum TaxID=76867 RepID=A0A0C2XGW7_HEBCY|nr:hypothetical protein M413DRAFT_31238 [Hebeloma cylindrosporum h7]
MNARTLHLTALGSQDIDAVDVIPGVQDLENDIEDNIRTAKSTGTPSEVPVNLDRHRSLHVSVLNPSLSHKFSPAGLMRDVDEFKRVFLDALECHYHAYRAGCVLHCDISDKNLQIIGAEKSGDAGGILVDFDMVSVNGPVADKEETKVNSVHSNQVAKLLVFALLF